MDTSSWLHFDLTLAPKGLLQNTIITMFLPSHYFIMGAKFLQQCDRSVSSPFDVPYIGYKEIQMLLRANVLINSLSKSLLLPCSPNFFGKETL